MSATPATPTFPLAHGPNGSGHDQQAANAQQVEAPTEPDGREAQMRAMEDTARAAAAPAGLGVGEGDEEGITHSSEG